MNHPNGDVVPAAGASNHGTGQNILVFLKTEPLYWLLAAVPVSVAMEVAQARAVWMFLVTGVAIIPLAGLMGRATEVLSERLGPGIGGLLNATFGNAAELIIALMALAKGPHLHSMVKATITGSVIGNVLLVLGLSLALGGLKHRRQTFNRTGASMGAALLALAAIGLILPTVFYYHVQPEQRGSVDLLSEEIAVILAVTYGLSLIFSLCTHRHLFAGEAPADSDHAEEPEWTPTTATIVLLVATAAVALMSEFLVGSVEAASAALGMSPVFVGVIAVAIIGNAAEHSTAVLMALKNKTDLTFNIAVGSSIQVALFVAPVLVFASLLMGHHPPLDLHFTPLEVIAVFLSIVVLAMIAQDGESHWMEGVMLLAVYLMLALAFYHLPVAATASMATEHH